MNRLEKGLRKLFRLAFKRSDVKESLTLVKNEHLVSGEGTILVDNTGIRFDKEPEERVYVTIGNKCLIKGQFIFESDKGEIHIGNNVYAGGVSFISRSSITIEDDVIFAWDITLYDHDSHSIYWDQRKDDVSKSYDDYIKHNGNTVVNKDWSNVVSKPIRICSKAWIGFGVTILKGVTIGEGAVIGAKSVVTKDVAPWTVAAGNPAKEIKKLK